MSQRKPARARKARSAYKVGSKAARSRIAGHHQTRANSAKIAPGSAQQRAATTQTPRRPRGTGGGEERAGQARCP